MKFRFCGELDCPDWVLAEIATLARISSIKMKLLCNQVVNSILGEPIDFDKVNKLTADAKYEQGDVKATIAALSFIFTSSAKHSIDEESLLNELQQLGLPKAFSALVRSQRQYLRAQLRFMAVHSRTQ
ncbi:COMM domain-containing protein 4-like [Uloborus diversus]|uniref:COMM domain-containing protein 4-like n=1 Tax=Uloborus diversus TaxID=327109 RepID=UPI002409DCF1|nr:COMM domain-containing protein 4-like [Uloborus diversus]